MPRTYQVFQLEIFLGLNIQKLCNFCGLLVKEDGDNFLLIQLLVLPL